jgi:HJR/Mrr/RecB family endonuclease
MSNFWHDVCGNVQDMGRRRNRDFDFAMGVGQVVMLVFFGGVFVPSFRRTIIGLGMTVIGVIVTIVLVMVGLALVCRSKKRAHASSPDFLTANAVLPYNSGTAEASLPQTTVDLITQLRGIDWFQFEKVVAFAYRRLGYTVTRRGGANPDGGIDLIIEMAGQKTAVQCKQWKTWTVGVKPVREFLGALTASEIQKGIFVTLCGYTGDAKQFADENRIEIVNEVGLAKLLESTNALFDPEVLEILHDKRKCCPKCGAEMVLRTARKGTNPGQRFWGCSNFSTRRCQGSLPYQPRPHTSLGAVMALDASARKAGTS